MKRYTGQAKNSVQIQFQLNSGLFGNKNANVNYDLSAIVCHDGQSIYYGHYIAYCKDEDLNWREYNDLKSVRLVDFTEKNTQDYIFCSQNSYLIFYTLPETTNLDAVSSIEQKFRIK
jgi:ubiquitin C-terminal hydrolase